MSLIFEINGYGINLVLTKTFIRLGFLAPQKRPYLWCPINWVAKSNRL